MSASRRRVRAIFRKELREYRRNRTIVTGMAILPLLFLIQPLVAVLSLGVSASGGLAHEHELLYLLAIPALVSATLASYSVVSERQQGTLERRAAPGEAPAGWRIVRKPDHERPAAAMRAKPIGASQRYGLTHFHPGQIRNVHPKHNQAAT
jgi:hypothetical protein